MKKYLLSLTAIILSIGLNAFTPYAKTGNEDKTLTTYYWYRVDANCTTTSACLNPTVKKDKAAILPSTNCPYQGQVCCALGSLNNNLPIGTTLTPIAFDAKINKN